MKLQNTSIYPFISSNPELCELFTFQRNSYIIRASDADSYVWYLVEGQVKVIANGSNGKCIVVDMIDEDNFVGHLSNYYEQNFYCDSLAVTNCTLIRIPIGKFNEMMKGMEFSRLFFMKTSARLYIMYKMDLVNHLFTQQQQFAFYLLSNVKGDICYIQSLYRICEFLRVSRRNLYNLIDKFMAEGYLERLEDGKIRILDFEAMREIQKPVADFVHNKI